MIDSIIRRADSAFASFDSAMTRIDGVVPSLADGKADELFQKVKSIRELAESFNKRSGALMEEGRRSLVDVSHRSAAITVKGPQATVLINHGCPLDLSSAVRSASVRCQGER